MAWGPRRAVAGPTETAGGPTEAGATGAGLGGHLCMASLCLRLEKARAVAEMSFIIFPWCVSALAKYSSNIRASKYIAPGVESLGLLPSQGWGGTKIPGGGTSMRSRKLETLSFSYQQMNVAADREEWEVWSLLIFST